MKKKTDKSKKIMFEQVQIRSDVKKATIMHQYPTLT